MVIYAWTSLILLAMRSIVTESQGTNMCVTGVSGWNEAMNGKYVSGDHLINEKQYYTKQGSNNIFIYSYGDNWYFTRDLALGANMWITSNGGISGANVLAWCKTGNIASPKDCQTWGFPDTLNSIPSFIYDNTCPPTPSPTHATPAPTYQGTVALTITNEQKQYLVDQHNYYRGQVALGLINGFDGKPLPKAAKMYSMSWDDDIALNTQNWANQCLHTHSNLNGYGAENIIWGWNDKAPLEDATRSWVNEHERYIYGQTGTPNGVVGHFTNIIRETNTRFGCGFTKCPVDHTYNGMAYWFVCGYKSDGNHIMDSNVKGPYTSSDTTGSQCKSSVVKGLCQD